MNIRIQKEEWHLMSHVDGNWSYKSGWHLVGRVSCETITGCKAEETHQTVKKKVQRLEETKDVGGKPGDCDISNIRSRVIPQIVCRHFRKLEIIDFSWLGLEDIFATILTHFWVKMRNWRLREVKWFKVICLGQCVSNLFVGRIPSSFKKKSL